MFGYKAHHGTMEPRRPSGRLGLRNALNRRSVAEEGVIDFPEAETEENGPNARRDWGSVAECEIT